jgi:membrane associated rhomboid family serine protease
VIPISDSVQARSFPFVNIAIILTNIVVFMYEVYLSQQSFGFQGATELDVFILHWGNIPPCTLDVLGREAVEAQSRACLNQPQPFWTPFTAMFMHGGWLHLAGNMLFLWVFGDNIEDALGHVRYAVFYVVGGIAAAFAHMLFNADDLLPAIGASGAIAAVMGAYIVLYPRATVLAIFGFLIIPLPFPVILVVGLWFLMQLFYGVAALGPDTAAGGVAYFAHIGGFIAGAAMINLFVLGRRRPRLRRRGQYA